MPKSILIIEDEKSIQNILKAFLEDAGYNRFTVSITPTAGTRAAAVWDYTLSRRF